MNCKRFCFLLVAFATVLAVTTSAHTVTYGIMDLGTLGGASSSGFGINESGHVTGISKTIGGDTHVILYDGTTMHDLGTFGGDYSQGWRINDSDQVVG